MPITVAAPISEHAITATESWVSDVAFNADDTIGLAILDGTTFLRATTAGAWVATDVEDLFDTPDGQLATGVAWGAGGVAVMVGTYNDGTGHTWALFTSDGGLTWDETATDLSVFDGALDFPRVASNGSNGFVFIQTDPTSTYEFLAGRSSDGGETWTIANGPAVDNNGTTLRVVYTSGRWFGMTFSGPSYSDDSGATWSSVAAMPGTGVCAVADMAVLGSALIGVGAEDVLAAALPAVWRSNDNGGSWSQLSSTGVSGFIYLASVAAVGGSLVASGPRATPGSCVVSSSNATAWTSAPVDTIPIAPAFVTAIRHGFGRIYGASNDAAFAGTAAVLFSSVYSSSANITDVFSRGGVRYRLQIEGCESEFCDDITLAGDSSEGRIRYAGLVMDGAVLSERAEIREGTTKVSPLTLRVLSSASSDREFGKSAARLAYLSASVATADATTIDVTDASFISDGDFIHLGTECCEVTAVDGTELTVTRQSRGTLPQAHTIGTGAVDGWSVPVYDRPPTMQGRRAILTAYPIDTTDLEAVVWRGRLSGHPYMDDEGTSWVLDIDHISLLMDQTIGEIVAGEASLAPLAVYHKECQFSFAIEYTRDGTVHPGEFALEGTFATDGELFTAILDAIDGLPLTGLSNWEIVRNGDGLMQFTFDTDSEFAGEQLSLRVGSSIDGVYPAFGTPPVFLQPSSSETIALNGARSDRNFATPETRDLALAYALTSSTRGCVGSPRVGSGDPDSDLYVDPDLDDSDLIIYLERDIGLVAGASIITLAGLINPADGSRFEMDFTVAALTDGGATVTLQQPGGDAKGVAYYDAQTTAYARVDYGSGNWRDLLQTVVDQSYQANTGATPFVTGFDLESSDFFTADVTARINASPSLLGRRRYQPAIENPLIDVLRSELVASGCLLRMSANGLIGVAAMKRPTALSPTSALVINDDVIATPTDGSDAKWPRAEASPDGVICTITLKDGDTTYLARDLVAVSHYKNRGAGNLELEFLSTFADARQLTQQERLSRAFSGNALTTQPERIAQFSALGASLLGFFSSAHTVITLTVNHRAIGLLVGDYVRLTTVHLIDPTTGLRGFDATCMVVGREWPLDVQPGQVGTVTLLTFPSRVAGYAPSAYGTGFTGFDEEALPQSTTLTVLPQYFSSNEADPVAIAQMEIGNDLDHFAVGDPVRVIAYDTASTLGFRGVITSIPTDATVVISVTEYFGDIGLRTPIMEFDHGQAITENQAKYVFIADASGQFDGEPGFDFE